MINGIHPSQLDMRNRSLHIHYNKLTQIVNGPSPSISTFNRNFCSIVQKKRWNHIKWKHFKFNEEQDKLLKQNQIVKDKIVRILTASKPRLSTTIFYETSRDFSKSNYFYERKRLQTSIDKQNPQIAKRILKASGMLSHKRDNSEYKKSRQFVKRLERFPMLKRLQNSIQSSRRRFKTQMRMSQSKISVSSRTLYNSNSAILKNQR